MDTKKKVKQMELIEAVKHKIYFLRPILRPFYHSFIAKRQASFRNDVFKENAEHVLFTFDKAMKEGGFTYTLAFGTLLGAVREKGFIKHDLDIDTAMWASDYNVEISKILGQYGFKKLHQYVVENGRLAREESYILDGVSIDIFFFYPAIDELPYCCDFINHEGKESLSDSMKQYSDKMKARRIQLPLGHETKLVPFESLLLPIPTNAEEILSFRYGPDFMTPNPNWSMVGSYDKHITIWHEKKVEVKNFE